MMKKLLFIVFLINTLSIDAQILYTDNFTGFTVGNIGTNTNGTTAGQGGFFTSAQDFSADNSNFQIVDEGGVYGNVAQIIGFDGDAQERLMWRNGINTTWSTRTSGNNILEVEYDFFTGAVSTSRSRVRVYIVDAGFTRYLAGFSMDFDTKIITGLANTFYNLGAGGTTLALTPNTWVKLGLSFNKSTGEVKFKGPGFNRSIMGGATGIDPDRIYYTNLSGIFDTVSGINKFDNLIARASNVDTLLGNETFKLSENVFAVSPNPVKSVFAVSNSENINVNAISIADLNGRVIKKTNYNSISNIQVDLSELSSGMYIMNIYSDQGIATKKIVKE